MAASTLGRIIEGLLGGAFALRTLDDQKDWYIRLGYGLVGFDLLRSAWTGEPVLNGLERGVSQRGIGIPALGRTGKLNFVETRVRSIDQRVQRISEQLAKGVRDPKVYGLARAVLGQRDAAGNWVVPEKDSLAEIRALFAAVKSRVRYTWDPLWYDAFQTPGKTLELKTGDCDDMFAVLGSMLISVGYRIRARIVQTVGNDTWNHIYLLVEVPSTHEWIPLDLTVNQPMGWEVPTKYIVKIQDYNVSERGQAQPTAKPTQTTSNPSEASGASF